MGVDIYSRNIVYSFLSIHKILKLYIYINFSNDYIHKCQNNVNTLYYGLSSVAVVLHNTIIHYVILIIDT